ncbi:MAG: type II toxin-antitoxin system HicA family toxin [Elusimicrobiota bacterium]|jgi:predicted RNA binding protein YcfA (HicA-like mRNA interferase family)|nr:type II toxin-antitoxin system HicA family toxin [Elusimicrobiota bacterium]
MGGLDTVKLSKLRKLLKNHGFIEKRQTGSHLIINRPSIYRPIVIAIHGKDVFLYCSKEIMKELNMSRDEFLKELKKY